MAVFMIILSVLLIIGGIQCIATPAETFYMLGWFVGLSIAISGIVSIFRYASGKDGRSIWELIGGIVGVLFGGLVVLSKHVNFITNMVIAYAAALWLLVYGVMGIVEAWNLRKFNKELPSAFRTASWLAVMVLSVATAVMGVMCVIRPIITIFSVGLLVGLSILITGIKSLILSIQLLQMK